MSTSTMPRRHGLPSLAWLTVAPRRSPGAVVLNGPGSITPRVSPARHPETSLPTFPAAGDQAPSGPNRYPDTAAGTQLPRAGASLHVWEVLVRPSPALGFARPGQGQQCTANAPAVIPSPPWPGLTLSSRALPVEGGGRGDRWLRLGLRPPQTAN